MKEYLKSEGRSNDKINPTVRSKIIFGIASAMSYMHHKCIAHGDLSLDNIFLDEHFEPKLIGFGITTSLSTVTDYPFGDPSYLAPEVLVGEELPSPFLPSDVYSFAIILYKLFSSNKNQFSDGKIARSRQQIMMKVSRGYRFKRTENISDAYWELIQRCWSQDPEERPTFEEIVEELKDDKYAIKEFGMSTNLDELHEFQQRIEEFYK